MVYASAFKGRKQLVWTNGLRDLFSTGCLGEVTDEEIATEHREDASLFAELTFEQWKVVYQTKSEAYLLKVVEERPLEFDAFIEGLEKLYVLMGKPDRGRKSKTLNKSVNNKKIRRYPVKFYKVKDKHKELISLDIDGKYIGAILVLIFLVAVVVLLPSAVPPLVQLITAVGSILL